MREIYIHKYYIYLKSLFFVLGEEKQTASLSILKEILFNSHIVYEKCLVSWSDFEKWVL